MREQGYIKVVGDIPINLKIKRGSRFLFVSKDQQAFTHAIHKYPAKFFPELPRWLIQKYSKKGDCVLDPFMGSGTTNVEALLCGRDSVGVDIDPFSRMLAEVKTTPININKLKAVTHQINKKLDRYASTCKSSIPDFPYKDNWFKYNILKELAYIKECIETVGCSQKIKNFLLVCFSSIIRRVSQADDNCTRTVIRKKLNKQIKAGYPISLFKTRLVKAVHGMNAFVESTNGNAVKIPKRASAINMSIFSDNVFDLAITSPPYVNAVDYPRTHQLEMYWLGIVDGSLTDLKRQHVGTETVSVTDYKHLHKTGIRGADTIINRIFKIDPRRAYIASKYIIDMWNNLDEIYRVLKPGGRYIIVIGSNRIRGNLFENWRYIKDAAKQSGYKIESYFISGIINHFIKIPRKERIDEDYILILQK